MYDFEKKLEEVKKILEELNNPDISLHKAMELYKKGNEILKEATKIIEEAKLEFEKIT
jgi:exodeoxyribonuclease VII small subunit